MRRNFVVVVTRSLPQKEARRSTRKIAWQLRVMKFLFTIVIVVLCRLRTCGWKSRCLEC